MVKFEVLICGRLKETAESGGPVVVPRGHCQVQAHEGFVSLAWLTEAGSSQSATISAHRFAEHLEAGAIVIVDAAQLRERV